MVYIRPSAPAITTTAVKPIAQPANTPDEHPLSADTIVNEHLARQPIERRKQDRRQQRKNALLETRAGRDRRKNNPSINVSI